MNNLQRLYTCKNYFNLNLSEKIEKEWENRKESDNSFLTDMGLLNGYAGEGLLRLTAHNYTDISWMNLL
jgi:hypothetical protein